MSNRSGTYYHHGETAHRHRTRAQAAHRVTGAVTADYTLGHAGRQVRLGPIAFWIVVGTLVVMAVWTIATGTYFAFRDDVLTRLIGRQAEMQFAYEDRIAELRAQVDRITSRQLLDQEQFDQKLDQIMRRQTTLESRAATLTSVADPSVTGSIAPGPRGDPPAGLRAAEALADQRHRDLRRPARPWRTWDRARCREPPAIAVRPAAVSTERWRACRPRSIGSKRGRPAALNSLEEDYDAKARRMRGVLADLGLDPPRAIGAQPRSAALSSR